MRQHKIELGNYSGVAVGQIGVVGAAVQSLVEEEVIVYDIDLRQVVGFVLEEKRKRRIVMLTSVLSTVCFLYGENGHHAQVVVEMEYAQEAEK